jgi:hypothetical protein
MIDALKLKDVDMDYRNNLQAYLNMKAQATKKNGKPVYDKFEKFYDYESEIRKAKGVPVKKRFSGLAKFLQKKAKKGEN